MHHKKLSKPLVPFKSGKCYFQSKNVMWSFAVMFDSGPKASFSIGKLHFRPESSISSLKMSFPV